MKKLTYLFILLTFAGLLWSCEENEPELVPFSEVGYYTSLTRTNRALWASNVGGYISFTDLSRNPLSHQWIIPGEGAAFFLQGPIDRRDTAYAQFIVNPGDTITGAATAHVYFAQPGLQTVTLRNIFADSVAFAGQDTVSTVLQEDGTWLYEEEMVVDVYDSITANFRVFLPDGSELTFGTDTLFIEAGLSLTLEDLSTGRPDDWTWTVRPIDGTGSTISVSGEDANNVVLPISGELEAYRLTLTARRTGENVPGGSKSLSLPNPIKITPAPPRLAGTITELENQTIQIPLTVPIKEFSGIESFFNVTLNGAATTVTLATVNSSNSTRIDLTIGETIYSDDDITVTLADGSGIVSSDGFDLGIEAFTDAPVTMFLVNILDEAGIDSQFENALVGFEVNNLRPQGGGGAAAKVANSSVVLEASGGEDGGGVMRINLDNTGATADSVSFQLRTLTANPLTFKNGVQYGINFDYRTEGLVDQFTFRMFINGGFSNAQNRFTKATATTWTNVNGVLSGPSPQDDSNTVMVLYVIGNSGADGVLFLDNLQIFEADYRP
ncbi:MAG: hypothetical protein AAF551_03365 [Bacteroidota bacterium]